MEDEITAIRQWHDKPEPFRYGYTEEGHEHVGTLLRALDAATEENARLREALKPFAEARLESWGQRTQGVGDYLTRVWINTAPNVAVSNARAALKEPGQ
jgi:hypothetical protein